MDLASTLPAKARFAGVGQRRRSPSAIAAPSGGVLVYHRARMVQTAAGFRARSAQVRVL